MAYLGGNHCAMSPLFGVPVMHKYLKIMRKIESCPPPPPWNLGRKCGQKNGLNLSEDLFFLVFIILKFPAPPPPPPPPSPFENPAYASGSYAVGKPQKFFEQYYIDSAAFQVNRLSALLV